MSSVHDNAISFLAGGGEMGDRIRSYPWSETSLGPIETWPQSLRTSLSLILTSYYPLFFWWGEDHIQFYNDAYMPILGAKHPKSLGQEGKACWPEAWHLVAPLIEAVKRGESTFNKNTMLPLQRNGYVEECYFDFAYSPIRNESGAVAGIFAAVAETTDQVINERRLNVLTALGMSMLEAKSTREACQVSLKVLSSSPIDIPYALIYLKEGDHYKLAGSYGLEACPGAQPDHIPLTSTPASATWDLQQVISSRQPYLDDKLTARFGELPGTPWPAPSHSALLLPLQLPAQKEPIGVFVAGISPGKAFNEAYSRFLRLVSGHIETAISNGRTYEEERLRIAKLEALDQAKTNFFSNVSHEFRTPLTLMLGPLQDLLSAANHTLSGEDRKQLTMVYQNGQRLLKLVNTLLDFSRIEAKRAQVCYVPTNLCAFTAELASAFEPAMGKAGLRYEVACDPLSEPVYIDPDMWEKIVLNLISNAFKFTFEGQIKVTIKDTGNLITLQVQDTGVGIPPEELPHLFTRFHRVQHSRSRSHEGTGIGLALVKELVDLHAGSLEVSSTLGEGSTFTVCIPKGSDHLDQNKVNQGKAEFSTTIGAAAYVNEALLWSRHESPAGMLEEKKPLPALAVQPDSQTRILLADDNADMLQYLQRILSAYWQVEAVKNGEEALAATRRQAPDLILSDSMMPGMSGLDLLAAIRCNEPTRHIPVILLSARAGEEAMLEALENGANDYLVKPFSSLELIARIRTQLEVTRTRRDNVQLRETEEALKKFKIMSDYAFDSFILMREDGTFAYLNDLALQRWGYTREEALTLRVPDVDPIYQDELFNEVFARSQKEKIPTFETLHKRKDGSIYPVEVSMGGITLEGKPHMFAIARDITDRKQAAEALAASEERFRNFANNIQNLAWMTHQDGWTFWYNQRWFEYTGTTMEEIKGWGWRDFIHPDHLERITAYVAEATNKDQAWEITLPLRGADGSYRWFLTRAYPVKDAEGRVLRWIGTNTDIEDQKRAEAALQKKNIELQKINNDLDNFIYTASHDLKAPITNIEGLVNTLVEDLPAETLQSPEIDKVISLIRGAIARFRRTISDLTDLSKLQRDIKDDVGLVSLPALLEEVCLDLEAPIKNTGASLEVDFSLCPAIRFSQKNLRSVVYNLVSNAVKYHVPGRAPLIRVCSGMEQDQYVLSVTDNGLGMDPSQQNKIFSMFKRLHDHVEGSGIGLYIVKKIVENSGGRIVVESEINKGSTFKIYLSPN